MDAGALTQERINKKYNVEVPTTANWGGGVEGEDEKVHIYVAHYLTDFIARKAERWEEGTSVI
jgi:hypothetical protein